MGALRQMNLVWELIAYDFGKLQGQKEQRSSEVKGASITEARLIGFGVVG